MLPVMPRGKYMAPLEQQAAMEASFGEMVRRLAKTTRAIYLNGAGEALASRHSRGLLESLTRAEYPNLRFQLISNGQLLDRNAWKDFDLEGR